jgi:hypothetical protein
LTLAVYVGGELRAVYPHVDDGDVRTVHEGVGTLESVTRDAGRSEDERHERRLLPASE